MLETYLNTKPIFYDKIDYTRFPRVYEKIKSHFHTPKIIHIIGTNGKGTTGRFLASALYALGFSVGHYTSPHIIKFNERIWLDGAEVSDAKLEKIHLVLQNLLTQEDATSLSYFEYTTLLAQMIFLDCDYIVLEAGLGGEHDATAVFPKILTLLTPVDIDHESFLGNTINEIATTKLKAVQNNLIMANQKYLEVSEIAQKLCNCKNVKTVDSLIDTKDRQKIKIIKEDLQLVDYLTDNLTLAISALKFLNLKYDEKDFKNAKLFGRLTKIQTNIIVDVGHNVLAAKSIYQALNLKKYILIYNSYKDKNYDKILQILKPMIEEVQIIEVNDKRIVQKEKLQNTLLKHNLKFSNFKRCQKDKRYLVFGSFSVVEAFLKQYRTIDG